MNKKHAVSVRLIVAVAVLAGIFIATPAFCGDAVSVILKNNSSASVSVELIDQYGGNFTASVDSGMSQNQTLKAGSEIKIDNQVVHVVKAEDEGKEVVIAGN